MDEHIDVLDQAVSTKVFMTSARVLLEYPGLCVVKLYKNMKLPTDCTVTSPEG